MKNNLTKRALVEIASEYGCKTLLGYDNAKTVKGEKKGYITAILYMMPTLKLCPMSKRAGCFDGCLVTAGLAGVYARIRNARQGRTDFFENDREHFMRMLVLELNAFIKKSNKGDLIPVVRLNGTSDINWTNELLDGKTIFELFPDIQFYDYTKRKDIMQSAVSVPNWDITASYSEASKHYAINTTENAKHFKVNMAVVFSGKMPKVFKGMPVVNGDESDLRFLDDRMVVVGLKAKGKARKDESGFVVHVKNLIASS